MNTHDTSEYQAALRSLNEVIRIVDKLPDSKKVDTTRNYLKSARRNLHTILEILGGSRLDESAGI